MYPDCFCINEFNYYGNTSILPDQASYNCQMWDSTKIPLPVQQHPYVFPTGFESSPQHQINLIQPPPLNYSDLSNYSDSSNLASAMTFCSSSSSSSLVSSPSPTQPNACFMPHTMTPFPSYDYMPPMPVNNTNYASYIPTNNMNTFGTFGYANVEKFSMKSTKCTKTKIYDCNLCTRSFARKHDLQRHIRVHTGAKPYYCLNCEKAFARTDALKRHLRMEEACRMSPVIQALKNVGMRRYRNL